MMVLVRHICLIGLIAICTLAQAQDSRFSQFMNEPGLLNPALTGQSHSGYIIAAHHRNQWSSFVEPFSTYAVYADVALRFDPHKSNHFSTGLAVIQSKSGQSDLKELKATTLGSFSVVLDKNNLT